MVQSHILLVEDDAPIKRMISKFLQMQGYQVGLASDGVEALKLVGEQLPDLVLTDVNMPRMNGLELARRLRSHHLTAQVPIVMLSALLEASDVLKGYAEGADDYVPKPIELSVLGAKIETLLRRRAPGAGAARPPGRLTAFLHGKGGVGTTTLAVNAGVAIAGMPMTSAALLDLDLAYGDAALLLNMKAGSTLAGLGVHGDGPLDAELLGLFTTAHGSGLALVQGCDRPERAEQVTVPAVQRAIAQMRASYDQVLVDLPSNFSEPTLAAIDAADRACIVVPPSLPGLRASRHCLEVLQQISFPLEKIAVILNRARPGGLAFEQVSQFLNHAPDAVVVYSETLEDCAAHGVPVVTGQPNSVVAHEIRALADFLAGTRVPA
ncbi:MAG TPA: response regulator [Candidatus Dormibacteraeota bacterium]|jgi:pilus assembly protein CpaE